MFTKGKGLFCPMCQGRDIEIDYDEIGDEE